MIFFPGEVDLWTILFTALVLGYGGLGIAAILGIIAGGLAATGSTAYGVKTAAEGNWPWKDPETWLLGHLKANVGGIGEVVSAAQGEPSLVEQIKLAGGGGTSYEGGTGGVLQGATGQGPAQASAMALGQTPEQRHGGRPSGGSVLTALQGANRWDQGEMSDAPSKSDIIKGAVKDIGIGVGTQVASFALPYVGQAIGSAVAPAAQAATSAIAPAVSSTVATGVNTSAPTLASTLANVGKQSLTSGLSSAGMGAAKAAIKGEPVGPAALSGLASGIVSGGLGGAYNEAFPTTTFREPIPTAGIRPPMAPDVNAPAWQPPYSWNPVTRGPTGVGATLARPIPRLGGGFAGGATGMALAPRPPMPPEPPYPQRPGFLSDMPGMPYGRRMWWS